MKAQFIQKSFKKLKIEHFRDMQLKLQMNVAVSLTRWFSPKYVFVLSSINVLLQNYRIISRLIFSSLLVICSIQASGIANKTLIKPVVLTRSNKQCTRDQTYKKGHDRTALVLINCLPILHWKLLDLCKLPLRSINRTHLKRPSICHDSH